MKYTPWNDYKADCLNESLADIGKGLDTESWFPRAENDPLHDFHIQNKGSVVILHPDSQPALEWCWSHLNEASDRYGKAGYVIKSHEIGAVVAGMRRDGLMSESDIKDAQEEMSRCFEAQQAIDDQNCGEYE